MGAGGRESPRGSANAANVTITGGAGADTVYTNGAGNLIQYAAGDGKDIIFGFDAKDSIQITSGTVSRSLQSGANVLVTVGSGSANVITIRDTTLDELAIEDSYIFILDPNIYLSEKADTTQIGASNVYVHALGGNDRVTLTGDEVTIEGGKGNDSIVSSGANNLFLYANGDGSDTIVGFERGDSIKVTGGTVTGPTWSSTNATFKVGSGKIVLRGVDGTNFSVENNIITVADIDTRQTISGTEKADSLENSLSGAVIVSYGGIDTIRNSGGNVTISAGSGNDKIFNSGDEVSIDGGAGADLISLSSGAEAATVYGGVGNETIYSNGNGNLLQYANGDGRDNIFGFSGSDSVSLTSGAVVNYQQSGASVLVTVTSAANVLTFKNTQLSNFNFSGSLITSKVSGSNGYWFAEDENFVGGAGNDTLIDGNGNDVFVYSGSKDVITDYAAGDKIKISGTIIATKTSGSNVIYTIDGTSTKTLTVKGGKDKIISLASTNGNAAVPWFAEDDTNFVSNTARLDEISKAEFDVMNVEISDNFVDVWVKKPNSQTTAFSMESKTVS